MSNLEEVPRSFVIESNRIEGIYRPPRAVELVAHESFYNLKSVLVNDLQGFVRDVADAQLRNKPGLDVRIGTYFPPAGSPDVADALAELLDSIHSGDLSPYEAHVAYEGLHPFTDGNGRSGRILWAWHMKRSELNPFSLPFLHRFYYQSLSASHASQDRA